MFTQALAGPSRRSGPALCKSLTATSTPFGSRSHSTTPGHSTTSNTELASHTYLHSSASIPGYRAPPAPASASASASATASSPSSGSSSAETAQDAAHKLAGAVQHGDLPKEARNLVHRIVRVDQAGELGANWIYRGQKWGCAVRGDTKSVKDVEDMWQNERHHLSVMRLVQTQHGVRPTALYPLWQGMAFGLGAATALMGRHAAMACTEAVETVIGEHYDDQIRELEPHLNPTDGSTPHPSLPLMKKVLEEFRDDELGHLDTAVEEGAQKAPGHSLLSAVIGAGCRVAIKVCERI